MVNVMVGWLGGWLAGGGGVPMLFKICFFLFASYFFFFFLFLREFFLLLFFLRGNTEGFFVFLCTRIVPFL